MRITPKNNEQKNGISSILKKLILHKIIAQHLSLLAPPFGPTYQHPIKLDHKAESYGARCLKGSKELNSIPKSLRWCHFILNNSSISFMPHKPLLEFPKAILFQEFPYPLYVMVIISQILLRGTQSNLSNLNNLCLSPIVNEQCKKNLKMKTIH